MPSVLPRNKFTPLSLQRSHLADCAQCEKHIRLLLSQPRYLGFVVFSCGVLQEHFPSCTLSCSIPKPRAVPMNFLSLAPSWCWALVVFLHLPMGLRLSNPAYGSERCEQSWQLRKTKSPFPTENTISSLRFSQPPIAPGSQQHETTQQSFFLLSSM